MRKSLGLTGGKSALLTKNKGVINIIPIKGLDVMDLYASVNPKGKFTDPEVAIAEAKRLKAENDYS